MSDESVTVPDIPHADGVALLVDLHDDVLNRLDRAELIVGEDVVVEVAGFDVARREDQVGGFDGLDDVEDREASGVAAAPGRD